MMHDLYMEGSRYIAYNERRHYLDGIKGTYHIIIPPSFRSRNLDLVFLPECTYYVKITDSWHEVKLTFFNSQVILEGQKKLGKIPNTTIRNEKGTVCLDLKAGTGFIPHNILTENMVVTDFNYENSRKERDYSLQMFRYLMENGNYESLYLYDCNMDLGVETLQLTAKNLSLCDTQIATASGLTINSENLVISETTMEMASASFTADKMVVQNSHLDLSSATLYLEELGLKNSEIKTVWLKGNITSLMNDRQSTLLVVNNQLGFSEAKQYKISQ